MKYVILIAIIILIPFFWIFQVSIPNNSLKTEKKISSDKIQVVNSDTITARTFKEDSGWGYDIFVNGKLYIHQPNIPAVSGDRGFTREEYAIKVALLVIEKIKDQIIPPSVKTHELDSLHVLR